MVRSGSESDSFNTRPEVWILQLSGKPVHVGPEMEMAIYHEDYRQWTRMCNWGSIMGHDRDFIQVEG